MTEEIRIYVADGDSYYKDIDGEGDIEDIMDCAESQGTVFTLPEFIKQFNNGEVNLSGGNTVIRACYFNDNQFVGEV